MKKLFAVLALAGLMVACNSKKKTEKTAGTETTTPTTTTGDQTTTPTTTTTTTASTDGVPTFSDPETQKFANDYAAFIDQYITGVKDPSKMAELSKNWMDFSKRAQDVGMKLATHPEDA